MLNHFKIAPQKEIVIREIDFNVIFYIEKIEIVKDGENVYHVYENFNGKKHYGTIKESWIDGKNFEKIKI